MTEDDHGEELRRAEEEEAQNEECHTVILPFFLINHDPFRYGFNHDLSCKQTCNHIFFNPVLSKSEPT